MTNRIIPCLLLKGAGFYKTTRFKDPIYLGDPINILRIFNEKEVDEITILDIGITPKGGEPNFPLLQDMASECFMPLAYGGGIKTMDQIHRLFQIGFEKVVLNSHAFTEPELVRSAAATFGSQSIVVCIDARKALLGGYAVVSHSARSEQPWKPETWARRVAELGAGEIIINSVNRDGTMTGYDIDLIQRVTSAVNIPVIACGGASSVNDFKAAIKTGHASACAAGAMFVFQGRHRAVLINVPPVREIRQALA